jgi:hypothetical protein
MEEDEAIAHNRRRSKPRAFRKLPEPLRSGLIPMMEELCFPAGRVVMRPKKTRPIFRDRSSRQRLRRTIRLKPICSAGQPCTSDVNRQDRDGENSDIVRRQRCRGGSVPRPRDVPPNARLQNRDKPSPSFPCCTWECLCGRSCTSGGGTPATEDGREQRAALRLEYKSLLTQVNRCSRYSHLGCEESL